MSEGPVNRTTAVVICSTFFILILFICITEELYIINPFGS